MVTKLFEEALRVVAPWYVEGVDFDVAKKLLTIEINFTTETRFAVQVAAAGIDGEFPVHDTEVKQYRHLSFFQHECILSVRVPRVILPDGRTRVVAPPWSGRLRGFTLLFEAFVLLLVQHGMNFSDAARTARGIIISHRWQTRLRHH